MTITPFTAPSTGRQTVALALCFAAAGGAVFVSTDGWYAGLQ